jgi:hypothetical protein
MGGGSCDGERRYRKLAGQQHVCRHGERATFRIVPRLRRIRKLADLVAAALQ